MSVSATPFADGAWNLQRSDWGDPHVVDFHSKKPKLSGWSGYDGATPDDGQVRQWVELYPSDNLGLRLAEDMVGFDIDDGDGKAGAATWAEFELRHGEQDATWSVTARGPHQPRRTLLFSLSDGVDTRPWRDSALLKLGGDIELIRRWHRHQLWSPSVHPDLGTEYVVYDPSGERFTGDVLPLKVEVPQLSDEFVVHMDKTCVCFYVPRHIRIRRERAARRIARMAPSSLRRGALALLDGRAERLAGMGPDTYRNGVLNNGYHLFLNQVHGEHSLTEDDVWDRLYNAGIDAGLGEDEIVRTLTSARNDARTEAGWRDV